MMSGEDGRASDGLSAVVTESCVMAEENDWFLFTGDQNFLATVC